MKAMNAAAILIRPATPADIPVWEELRCAHWPDGAGDHAQEIASFFAGTLEEPAEVLIAEDENRTVIAFAELSIRTDLPGLEGQRAGYVEGLYIRPEFRGGSAAWRLLQESRQWARNQACTIFASDRAERIIIDRSFSRPHTSTLVTTKSGEPTRE
jgi:aminoglycoside 6'-N-acetyltransferase I